ncbi:MAG: CHAD domain-containing protein [Pseudomonadales bacterium]|nr:CHAD domain-containing protein [Pseudomonadales bacterium]MCP5189665.1 CHAD domain-containing protein [Pseudomonadales bacterium]
MKRLSKKLAERRQRLLERYDPEDLHALRVTLRRIRSRLKQLPGKKAARLRQELRVLADATNAARDWDTLLASAGQLLSAQQLATLQATLEQRQLAARENVTRMLQSASWSATFERWDDYEQTHAGVPGKAVSQRRRKLARTVRKLATARTRALAEGSERHWHKLRIAIKDLRYQVDATPKRARTAREADMLALCKQLQVSLGEWHDAVVHTRLLRELAQQPEPASDAAVTAALASLRKAVEERGLIPIEQARQTLNQTQVLAVLGPLAEGV